MTNYPHNGLMELWSVRKPVAMLEVFWLYEQHEKKEERRGPFFFIIFRFSGRSLFASPVIEEFEKTLNQIHKVCSETSAEVQDIIGVHCY